MSVKLFALMLEDVQKDAQLLYEILSEDGFDLEYDLVENESDYVSHLKRHNYDIIFADFTLPSFNGEKALMLAQKLCPNVPFICISGTIGEDRAVELLKQGATDYVLKDRMERLPFATHRALDAVDQLNKFRITEIEMQTNRRLLQTIINNALDAIYIKDLNGKYLLFNEAAEKTIGKSAREVIGRTDFYLFTEEEARMKMEADRQVIEKGSPLTLEETLTYTDGSQHIFHVIKCPMFDEGGNPTGLFAIARDITERKQMEQVLTLAKEEAEESNRLKTAFLHNISHEIRTPMNAIIGFSGFMNNPDFSRERLAEFAEIISRSSYQLLSIVTDIVNISTLEAGQTIVNKELVNVNNMIQSAYEQYASRAETRGIMLRTYCELPDQDAVIFTDQVKFGEILSYLVNNAIKFTRQGYVKFGYVKRENWLEFFVEDTGIGISPEMQDCIFERFRQVESNIARRFGGTGLGLSISKGYVELLGGKIWLTSKLEKGSTFYFTLPYNPEMVIPIPVTSKRPETNYMTEKLQTILVAEDEDLNYMYIERILAEDRYLLIRAYDGQKAVEICQTTKVDMILMDLKMPNMDGYEAIEKIRAFLPNVPIVAQTAYSTESDKRKVLECGGNDFISKPFTKELLISKIQEYLQ